MTGKLGPIPVAQLAPLAQLALGLARDRLGKGNPAVGLVLNGIGKLIDQHGAKTPAELAPVKREITAALAADFAAMGEAFDRAEKAGQFKGG